LKIYILQGSAVTQLTCDRIFNNRTIAICSENVPIKEFWKSVNIWRRCGQWQSETFFWDTVYVIHPLYFRPEPTAYAWKSRPNWS